MWRRRRRRRRRRRGNKKPCKVNPAPLALKKHRIKGSRYVFSAQRGKWVNKRALLAGKEKGKEKDAQRGAESSRDGALHRERWRFRQIKMADLKDSNSGSSKTESVYMHLSLFLSLYLSRFLWREKAASRLKAEKEVEAA